MFEVEISISWEGMKDVYFSTSPKMKQEGKTFKTVEETLTYLEKVLKEGEEHQRKLREGVLKEGIYNGTPLR